MATLLCYLTRFLPKILLCITLLLLMLALLNLHEWQRHRALNQAYDDRSLANQTPNPRDHLHAYSIGYLHAKQGNFREAARAFTLAEAANDDAIRARAKFALGNLYFSLGIQAADIAAGGAYMHAVAQIELAREIYKGALRIDPSLRDARYNLELIDRLSPPRRVEGWERETDGVILQPFKRDGWASMKDNTRRGLP